ncbi:MAG: diaminopimelate decarboxylase [Bacteroidetes bacterium]|nr:diaminopimelate decarboxylase [Bacteroidota bacterium]MBV6460828.1 Diaminopimelate decarboxylase [Flavobacteriales bacterium]WKZ75829.1 MAG: diaminopimelate decarboxylase [Vicingaceae bacterium]MCL4816627.1 diaminopimelate decarboxylase [Flavobacteriales bacterium]NOG95671.1 diaminopimelate decarboxylase [Bacteroidota bacterium]
MFNGETINLFRKQKTPFYFYDINLLTRTLQEAKREADKYQFHIHYALKANANPHILKLISGMGYGADCVSGNEIKRAVECGFPASHIVFAGVGKSDEEINIALSNNIFCFNCESVAEMVVLNELAEASEKKARIAIRINPNVNAHTHHYITTGLEENKFGISMWELEDVLNVMKSLAHIELIGLHFHIGSQITDLDVFKGLCIRINEIQQWFFRHQLIVDHINVGGGLGIDYYKPDENPIPDFEKYFSIFNELLEIRPKQKVHFELGRALVAQCGSLITKVLYVKKGVQTNFAIVDAGMTELLRPALYHAYHKIENLSATGNNQKYDVVGPICESSDCFGKAVELPETVRGDILALRSAGAYGEVMASAYNLRDIVGAVY